MKIYCKVEVDHPDLCDGWEYGYKSIPEIKSLAKALSSSRVLSRTPWRIVDANGYPLVNHMFEGFVVIDETALKKLASGKYVSIRVS